MVTVAEDAGYTASALTWSTDGISGEFTLTANENVEFGSNVTVAIANGEELGIKNVTFEITAGSVKVTLTKEQTAPVETPEQKRLEEAIEDLAAEIAKESDYTTASFEKFKEAYEAAKKAIADGETDAAKLNKLLTDLNEARGGLVNNNAQDPNSQPGQPGQSGQPGQPSQPEQPTQVIEAGKTYDDGKYNYKVLSTSIRTVQVTGIRNTAIKKVVVANSVKLGGKDYKVVSVAANAFKGNKKITSVLIKKNVKTIGKNAFAGCTRLKKVTISSTKLTTIGAKAFSGCKSLKAITIKSKVLKKVGKNAFKGIHKKAVIKVPKAKRASYKGRILKNKGQAKTVKIK